MGKKPCNKPCEAPQPTVQYVMQLLPVEKVQYLVQQPPVEKVQYVMQQPNIIQQPVSTVQYAVEPTTPRYVTKFRKINYQYNKML